MIEQDTVKLLRECDSGIKMGVKSIDDVIDHVHDKELKTFLNRCKDEHESLAREVERMLVEYGDDGNDPSAIIKGMSWIKTNMKLSMSETDKTIADLMTDGCNMGVKSLSKYLNQYAAADERSKDIAKRLIKLEAQLSEQMRDYL